MQYVIGTYDYVVQEQVVRSRVQSILRTEVICSLRSSDITGKLEGVYEGREGGKEAI